ncbi:hypothetical protein HaLaN_28803, partial [Haematococcus lacustris]
MHVTFLPPLLGSKARFDDIDSGRTPRVCRGSNLVTQHPVGFSILIQRPSYEAGPEFVNGVGQPNGSVGVE